MVLARQQETFMRDAARRSLQAEKQRLRSRLLTGASIATPGSGPASPLPDAAGNYVGYETIGSANNGYGLNSALNSYPMLRPLPTPGRTPPRSAFLRFTASTPEKTPLPGAGRDDGSPTSPGPARVQQLSHSRSAPGLSGARGRKNGASPPLDERAGFAAHTRPQHVPDTGARDGDVRRADRRSPSPKTPKGRNRKHASAAYDALQRSMRHHVTRGGKGLSRGGPSVGGLRQPLPPGIALANTGIA